MKKRIAKAIANVALKAAKSASGAASDWNVYQPKEPSILKKMGK